MTVSVGRGCIERDQCPAGSMGGSGEGSCTAMGDPLEQTECIKCSYFEDSDEAKPWFDCEPPGEITLYTGM